MKSFSLFILITNLTIFKTDIFIQTYLSLFQSILIVLPVFGTQLMQVCAEISELRFGDIGKNTNETAIVWYHDKLLIVVGLWYINHLNVIQYGIHNVPKLKSFIIIIMLNSCCKYKWCYSVLYQIEWHCTRRKAVKKNIIVVSQHCCHIIQFACCFW